jgi:hypothetical protein
MNENPPPIPSIHPAVPGIKQRHGCLTAWLILALIANSAVTIYYVVSLLAGGNGANMPTWALFLFFVASLGAVFCIVLLFRWRKVGFWGYAALGIFTILINLAIGMGALSLTSLVSIAVLYGVLQIGKTNKGWPQLE